MTISHFLYFLKVRVYTEAMSGKAEQNKLHKKNSLLSAALALLSSRDLAEVSISDITNRAGVAKGTFYSFFRDKEEIRDYLVDRESQRIVRNAQDQLDEEDIRNFDDAVIFMISRILQQLSDNPLLLRLIRRSLSMGVFHKELQSTLGQGGLDLANRFEAKARECGVKFENAQLVYFMILELTGSVCYSSIVYGIPCSIEELKPVLFDTIRAILASAKKNPQEDTPLH